MTLQPQSLLLFQGDSITDGARGNDPNHYLGHGYVFLLAARIMAAHPELSLRFLNRGASGHCIADLYARWKRDTINLQPAMVSLLIGVNDVGRELGDHSGSTAAEYERTYTLLLDDTLRALPDVQLVLIEPFILPVGGIKDAWHLWWPEIRRRQDIVEDLAHRYGTLHVPVQALLDQAADATTPEYWLWDGVHPTPAGHELLASAWLATVNVLDDAG